MNKLPQVLLLLMEEQDLTVSELARRTGIGQPVIHRLLSGETDNPKVATLSPIANYFAISISQLIGDDLLPKERISGTFRMTSHGWTTIPLLSWEQAIHWLDNRDSINIDKYETTDISVSENAYALRVKDTTMTPRFPENTLLVIDPVMEPSDRDYVVAHISNQKQAIFRQLLLDSDDTYLKPLNTDFKMILLNRESRLLGVMVQARMDFKK